MIPFKTISLMREKGVKVKLVAKKKGKKKWVMRGE